MRQTENEATIAKVKFLGVKRGMEITVDVDVKNKNQVTAAAAMVTSPGIRDVFGVACNSNCS